MNLLNRAGGQALPSIGVAIRLHQERAVSDAKGIGIEALPRAGAFVPVGVKILGSCTTAQQDNRNSEPHQRAS